MNDRFILCLTLCVCFITQNCRAELTWEKTLQEFSPSVFEESVTALFRFKNSGKENVSITKVRTSCGNCTKLKLDKKVYKPGELGQALLTYTFGSERGKHSKVTHIVTDDGKITTLKVSAVIPKVLMVPVDKLVWEKGNLAIPQKLVLINDLGSEETIEKVEVKSSQFEVLIDEDRNRGKYNLTVYPNSTGERVTEDISLLATIKSKTKEVQKIIKIKAEVK